MQDECKTVQETPAAQPLLACTAHSESIVQPDAQGLNRNASGASGWGPSAVSAPDGQRGGRLSAAIPRPREPPLHRGGTGSVERGHPMHLPPPLCPDRRGHPRRRPKKIKRLRCRPYFPGVLGRPSASRSRRRPSAPPPSAAIAAKPTSTCPCLGRCRPDGLGGRLRGSEWSGRSWGALARPGRILGRLLGAWVPSGGRRREAQWPQKAILGATRPVEQAKRSRGQKNWPRARPIL
jgi:hypothetical protein